MLPLKIFIFCLSSLKCSIIDSVPSLMNLFGFMLTYFPVAVDRIPFQSQIGGGKYIQQERINRIKSHNVGNENKLQKQILCKGSGGREKRGGLFWGIPEAGGGCPIGPDPMEGK